MKYQDITTVVYTILVVPIFVRSWTTASSYVILSKTNNGLLELQLTHGKLRFLETSLANSHSVHRIAFSSATDGLRLVRTVTRGGLVDDCITSTSSHDIASFTSTFSPVSRNHVKLSEAGVMDAYLKFSITTYPKSVLRRGDAHVENNISSFISPERTHSQSVAKFPDFRLSARVNTSGTSPFLNMFRTHLQVADRTRECEKLLVNAVKALQIISIAVHTDLKGNGHLTTINKTMRASLRQRYFNRFWPNFSSHISEYSGIYKKQEVGAFNMSTWKKILPSDGRAVSSGHIDDEFDLYRKKEIDVFTKSTSGIFQSDVPAIPNGRIHEKSHLNRKQEIDPFNMSASGILPSDVRAVSSEYINEKSHFHTKQEIDPLKMSTSIRTLPSGGRAFFMPPRHSRQEFNMSFAFPGDKLNTHRSMNDIKVQNESVRKTLEHYSRLFVSGFSIHHWKFVNGTIEGASHLGKYKHIGTNRKHQTDRNHGTGKHLVLETHSLTGRYHGTGRIQGSSRQFKLHKQNESDIHQGSLGYKRADRRKATQKRRRTKHGRPQIGHRPDIHVLDIHNGIIIHVGTGRQGGSEKHCESDKYNESDRRYASYRHNRRDELQASDRQAESERLTESTKRNGNNRVLWGDTQLVSHHRSGRHHRSDRHRRLVKHHRSDKHRRLDKHQTSNIQDQTPKYKSNTNDKTNINKQSHKHHIPDRHHRSYRHIRANRHQKSNRRDKRHNPNFNTNDESRIHSKSHKHKGSHRHHSANRYDETDKPKMSHRHYTADRYVETDRLPDTASLPFLQLTVNASDSVHTSNTGFRTDRDKGTHAARRDILLPSGNLGRSKRDLLTGWMIFPGTKWCGDGDIAEHKRDMGYHSELDSCCRRHDLCPLVIPRLTWKYGIFNYRLHTLSHCRCDRKLRKCLQASSSPLAHLIGQIYFNVIGPECFKFTQRATCVQRLWWGGCQKWSTNKVAYSKRQRRFK